MRKTTEPRTAGCWVSELFQNPSEGGQDWKPADDIAKLFPKQAAEIIETGNLNPEASRTRCSEILVRVHDELQTRTDLDEKERRFLLDWLRRASKALNQSLYDALRWERGLMGR